MAKAAKSRKPRQKYVWHIARFRDRFEMPENLRKKRIQPLDFTRDFVGSNAGMEAAKYQEQAAQLGNGDGMRHMMLVGLFRELVNRASNQDRAYRGYLTDAEFNPVNVGQLAKSLRWPTGELQTAMKELSTAGLIERVPEPDYIADDEREFPSEGAEDAKNNVRRNSTERGGKRGKPSRTGNGRVPRPKEKRVRTSRPEGRSEGQDELGMTSTTPTTTPGDPKPVDPNESEGGQAPAPHSSSGPAPSVHHRLPPPAVPIGQCVKLHDFDADQFGLKVYALLGLDKRFEASSKEAKSEWRSFANWLIKAKAATPPTAWADLRERGFAKARHIAKYGKTAEKPGAVWFKAVGKPGLAAKARAG